MKMTNTHIEKLNKWGEVKNTVFFRDITTIRIGGGIACFFMPKDIFSLQEALAYLKENNIAIKIIGRGSDLVCGDAFFDGCVIRLDRFNRLEIEGTRATVGAGLMGMALAKRFAQLGLAGFEFASAIPGSIGGMTYMNAGAYKSSMSEVVERVRFLADGKLQEFSINECEYSYRSSIFQKHPDWVVVEVDLLLQEGDKEDIQQLMNDRSERRQASQPLDKPSAGSCFCNPPSDFSWRYIEGVGMRGYRHGGIQVSEKHPNFIVNIDHASAKDFLEITEMIQQKVKEKTKNFFHAKKIYPKKKAINTHNTE